MTMAGKTLNQLRLVRELSVPDTRVQVRKLEGMALAQEYAQAQRICSVDFRGNLHAKTLRVDNELLVGSVNWTTASRGNHEIVAKIWLNQEGMEETMVGFETLWDKATRFVQDDYDEALRAREQFSGGSSSSTTQR